MPCYHPLRGYRSRSVNTSGKRSIVFTPNQGYADQPVDLPCGQCIGCRLERSRQWAIRCVHEASLYTENCFLTLTYKPQKLPHHGTLQVQDFQNFMKRFRKKHGKLRFFHCGEYGEKLGRPHYHAAIFGFDFKDKYHFKTTNGVPLYRSPSLEELWTLGNSSVGTLTFESAAYVARYITKKVTGKNALHHYNHINTETGEIIAERKPEYVTMSRRPGIGKNWIEKYQSDVYPDDFLILRGKKLKPPKYYNTQYELLYPEDYLKLKAARKRAAELRAPQNPRDRLDAGEYIQKQRFNQLKRELENEP